jgi:hypothetical protein
MSITWTTISSIWSFLKKNSSRVENQHFRSVAFYGDLSIFFDLIDGSEMCFGVSYVHPAL